jgi:hypothetical protein
MRHKAVIKKVEGLDDLYIDLPGSAFAAMGWNANTKLIWDITDEGNVIMRAAKHDNEPGLPVEFLHFLESNNNNDSSN